jgi:hypothetical protein
MLCKVNMRQLPHWTIVGFAIAGLALGLVTGILNKHVNIAIHKRFPKDGVFVTGGSLVVQFSIIIGVLLLATTYMPYITPDDLGAGISSFAFTNLYFAAQLHFVNEISKFIENRFDHLERYNTRR